MRNKAALPPSASEAPRPPTKRRTQRPSSVTKEQWEALRPAPLKKKLNKIAKELREQVWDNWHDGWWEQGETVVEWTEALRPHLQAILDVGEGKRLLFAECHAVLMIIGNSWRDLDANPSRLGTWEMLGELADVKLLLPWGGYRRYNSFFDLHPLGDMCGMVWRGLLRVAAEGKLVGEDVLFRAIKDATDNGVKLHSAELKCKDGAEDNSSGGDDEKQEDKLKTKEPPVVAAPESSALDALVARKEEWTVLGSNIRTFRVRAGRDHRFDSPPRDEF